MLTVMALGAGSVRCDDAKPAKVTRAQVKRTGPATMEIIPVEGQLPYCMLFTTSEKGIIRQLTLTRENRSIRCEANRPVANTRFRVPVQEGKVRVYVFFSDEPVQANWVARQLYELRDREHITAMDLRLPGRIFVETLEFTPETGAVVDAGSTALDAGPRTQPIESTAH
ncbi:hypothetical protein GTZ93_12305 [Corallococcus exiguus]|uniref:Uncharacterized protein n=1 Tax=Corallococcus exiguus TaxID=83462 RepID=A0A7X4Y9J6_9BACT|nr:hypothetical protein [Corallococcus exiguus]RKH29193.1 hypothetical protein D7V77_06765 [Corallococcus sp. CA041A]TNV67104.1 hypothetical protein FH620_02970 [Corallococcus exiguus]